MFARHYENGQKLPEELIKKLQSVKNYRSATQFMRQISYGITDLLLHTEYKPEKDGDAVRYARNIMKEYASAGLPDDYAVILSFTHLFDSPVGYAAGYYSYQWALALEADAFSRFRKEGILNQSTAESFRKEILSKGNSSDPGELFRNFMGRDLDTDAVLKRAGII